MKAAKYVNETSSESFAICICNFITQLMVNKHYITFAFSLGNDEYGSCKISSKTESFIYGHFLMERVSMKSIRMMT